MTDNHKQTEQTDLGFGFNYAIPYFVNAQSVVERISHLKAFIHDDCVHEHLNQFLLSLKESGWTEELIRERNSLTIQDDGMAGHYLTMLLDQTIGFGEDVHKQPIISISLDGDDIRPLCIRMRASEILAWLMTKGVVLG